MIWLYAFRHRIINLLLISVVVLGTFGILLTINDYIRLEKAHASMGKIVFLLAYYAAAYGLALILLFARRIGNTWRAVGFLSLLYFFSVLSFTAGWLGGGGRLYLLAFIVLSAILMGPRSGIFAALISLATYTFFGLCFYKGWLVYEFAPSYARPSTIISEGIGFSMSIGMVSIALWFFKAGLAAATETVVDLQKTRALLDEHARQLDAANQLLAARSAEIEEAFRLQAESEKRAVTRHQRLLDCSQELFASVDIGDVLDIIQKTAQTLVPFEVFAPFWVDEARQALVPAHPKDREWSGNPIYINFAVPLGKGIIGDVALRGQAECVASSHLDPRAIFPPGAREQIKQEHGLFLPVRVGEKVIGLLAFFRHELPPYTQDEFQLAQLLLSQAQLALRNARMFTELASSNRDLEAFSYSVSHDLRAPLRAINGFARILNDDFSAELSPIARGFLQKIRAAGDKMSTLIDGLLAFSRVGRSALRKQTVDLNEVAQSILENLTPELADRPIEWVRSELPPAQADPVLIQQVYANLIGNAVKYTGKRNAARIEIGSFNKNGEKIYFVRDNGAGFDMKYADKLFGVFQRLHSDTDFEGTGVGLATVQRIIHRHGGRIWAEAEPDKGATFYFTLSPLG